MKSKFRWILPTLMFATSGFAIVGKFSEWCCAEQLTAETPTSSPQKTKNKDGEKWVSLFDGKTLKGWKKTNFGGEAEVKVESGEILLEVGADMTGIHTDRKIPKTNYEVRWEAQRVNGSDFFCGLTFPVGKEHCSLIAGGWGGGVCGLSSIDGKDASENNTTSYRKFENKKWYRFRLSVTDEKIVAWIDGKKILEQERGKHKFSLRSEIVASKPFGFATWQTTGALRKIEIRKIATRTSSTKASKKND